MGFRNNFYILLTFLCVSTVYAMPACEINFVRYINGELPADISKNPMINMWDERFDPEAVLRELSSGSASDIRAYLLEVSKLLHKDKIFNNNFSHLLTQFYKNNKINHRFLKRNFLDKNFEHVSFHLSKNQNEVYAQLDFDPEKVDIVNKILSEHELSNFYKQEYYTVLIQSNRSVDEFRILDQANIKFSENPKDLEQFKKYIDFLDNSKPHVAKKGLAKINEIYNYSYRHGVLPFNPLMSPEKKFLDQMSRLKQFQERRVRELERTFKLHQKNGVVAEIDAAAEREANGLRVRLEEKLRFKKKIDDLELPHALKTRARNQALHETNIYRRLLNGCNSGSSQRLANAAKKFARFKFALALGVTPMMYVSKNKDKMDTDPYFWEKLGHEMVMGVMFTMVGNKLFTNSSTTFWRKYFEGYIKFGALSYLEAASYDELFGSKSLIRYFQKIYKPDVPESELELELEKLRESPTFEKDVKDLVTYLEEKKKLDNTKNFVDKYMDLSKEKSAMDPLKITQEDLESEEAREMVMELLAERIYLQNMGEWAFFQTGSKANDRFLFYRARNVAWDLKGLMLNLAIFELMCREPFGKIGSWGVILSLVIGDSMLANDVTYEYRREAINQ